MKITIEPSAKFDVLAGDPMTLHQTVTVEIQSDDIGIEQAIELMRSALIAFGYSPETVDQYFDQE